MSLCADTYEHLNVPGPCDFMSFKSIQVLLSLRALYQHSAQMSRPPRYQIPTDTPT
jgi:hypothetical protein